MAYDLPAGLSGNNPTYPKSSDGNISNRNVCSFLKATALEFLQIVYAQRDPGFHHFDADDEKTEIKIVDQYAFQLNAEDKNPAIIGVRGPISFSNIGMNKGMTSLDMRTGATEKTDLINGSLGLACLSRVGLEAEDLASEVFNLFRVFNGTLQKAGFFSIKAMELGTEQMVSAVGEPKLFMVNVSLQCQIQDRWRLSLSDVSELRNLIIEGLTKVA